MEGLEESLLERGSTATGHVLLDARPVIACALAQGDFNTTAYKKVQRRLVGALVFCVIFMIIEVVGGFIAHSLAIMTDAAHMLADVSGFGVSLLAGCVASRASASDFSYGYHRVEVLGALASTMTVWLVTGVLVYEAVLRIITPQPVDGKLMFFLAMAGVGVNVINFFILGHHGHSHGGHSHGSGHGGCGGGGGGGGRDGHGHGPGHGDAAEHGHHAHDAHGHKGGGDEEEGVGGSAAGGQCCSGGGAVNGHQHGDVEHGGSGHAGSGHDHHSHDHSHDHGHDHENINLKSAVVHVLGDLVQSVGVALAGALIWWKQDDPRYQIADPICTFLFAFLTLLTTRAIIIDIINLLMERVPRGHDIDQIANRLGQVAGVSEVHDLHVWSLTPGITLLAAHVYLAEGTDASEALASITAVCRVLKIQHTTIQLVVDGRPCPCHETPPAAAGGPPPPTLAPPAGGTAGVLPPPSGGAGTAREG